jgi:acyl carrier protein
MLNKSNSIDDKVAEIVAGLLPKRTQPVAISNEDSLTAAGLDSFGMVNLLLEIETSFNLTVPSRLVTPKSFRSISSISRLIETIALAA